MRDHKAAAIVSGIMSLLILVISATAQDSLRNVLERSWQAYLNASKSGQESQLEKTMSSFRLGTLRNNLADRGSSLTSEVVMSIAEDAPDLAGAAFFKVLEKGPTAALVYVKDSEEKDEGGKPQVDFIFIKFVKEEYAWRVDGSMSTSAPKNTSAGKRSDFNAKDLPATFEIDGQVRSAPKPVSVPDIPAFLEISSSGYRIQVTINGIEQALSKSDSHSGLLKGGLRKGKNTIIVIVTQIEKDSPFKPRVTIRRISDDRKTSEVFNFEPKTNVEGKHTFDLNIEK